MSIHKKALQLTSLMRRHVFVSEARPLGVKTVLETRGPCLGPCRVAAERDKPGGRLPQVTLRYGIQITF